MAFLHRTWTFQPIVAHEAIAEQVVVGVDVQPRRLMDLARGVTGMSEVGEYLEMIGYDDSWLDEDDFGEAHLYVTALGAHLDPAPNIEGPGLLVHYLRERLGWAEDEAWQVLRGEPLSTLPVDDPLMRVVRSDLARQFGGWLPRALSLALQDRLRGVSEHFHDPSPGGLAWIGSWSGATEADARRVLAKTYEDARAMLGALDKLPPGTALRCVAG